MNEPRSFKVATRPLGKNARGHNRRIGKGKRSSNEEERVKVKSKPKQQKTTEPIVNKHAHPGTTAFVESQLIGARGLKKKSIEQDKLGSVKISPVECAKFGSSIDTNNIYSSSSIVEEVLLNLGSKWLWHMINSSNVLIHGIGSKKKLLELFVKTYLEGEDVIELDGLADVTDKAFHFAMDTISSSIIGESSGKHSSLISQTTSLIDKLNKHYGRPSGFGGFYQGAADDISTLMDIKGKPGTPSSKSKVEIQSNKRKESRADSIGSSKWTGRYANNQTKLYFVIHSICGSAFQNEEVQYCLSLLAACESVAIIGSLDNIDAPARWDLDVMSRFNWISYHTSTFRPHVMNESFALVKKTSNLSDNNGKGLMPLLTSLTRQHIGLIKGFCANLREKKKSLEMEEVTRKSIDAKKGKKSKIGDSQQVDTLDQGKLLEALRKHFIVRDSREFDYLLKEYVDHKLLQDFDQRGNRMLKLLIPLEQMEEILNDFV